MIRHITTQRIITRQNNKASLCGTIGKHLINHNNSKHYHDTNTVSSNAISNFNVGHSSITTNEEKKLRFADILLWNQRQSKMNQSKTTPPPVEDKNTISKLVIPEMRIPEDPKIKKRAPINSKPFKIETYVGNCRRTDNHIQMSPPKQQTRSGSSHEIKPVYDKAQDNEVVRDQLMNWIRLESEHERIKYFTKKSEQMDKQLEESIEMSQGNVNAMPQYEFEPRQQQVQG